MKRIWSPWRSKFVQSKIKPSGCIFCQAVTQQDGVGNLIIARGDLAFVILNRFPYTTGHVMIVPFAHKSSYELLDCATRSEMMELISQATTVLRRVYQPEGFNVGANLELPAGAGIAGHVHFHIVPRWIGDTNFMSTVGEVRVLPEDLAESYRRLREGWSQE